MKCFILILSFFVSFQAQARSETYKLDRNKVVDHRNRVVSAKKVDSFKRYELNQKVKYTCNKSSKSQKPSEGRIESIRSIGGKHFVKVQGCDYLVSGSLISNVAEKLPTKANSSVRAVASASE